jgi:replicative DNA helicase
MEKHMAEKLSYPKSTTQDTQTEGIKLPPFSIEAEQAVLGGLMLDNTGWDKVADVITEEDFYRRDHRMIFSAIAHLANQGQPCDAVTLSEWLDKQNELDNVGGLSYLGSLANNTPTAANIKAYAEIVRERSVLRSLINVSNDISTTAYNPEGRSSQEVLEIAEQRVFEIADKGARGRSGFKGMKTLLTKAVDTIDKLFQLDSPITGVPTGFKDFDEQTAGLQNSDLVIVAGRPSMGKTTFAMNVVENASIKHQVPVAVFSMEMPGEQLAMRMMSSLGHIDQHKIRTGKLGDEDWPRLTSAVGILSEAKIYIDDTPAMSPSEVRARSRRIAREHGLGLIVIDYLQLMQGSPGSSKENRATEISEISRSLKALAKELNVPVVALSQLNRSLEQRPNKRPVMSDLRESGAIEQDADVIVFIYRDEVYNEDSPDKGTAEIIVGKQRNGPIGTTRLTFLGKYTRFENFINDPSFNNEGYS